MPRIKICQKVNVSLIAKQLDLDIVETRRGRRVVKSIVVCVELVRKKTSR